MNRAVITNYLLLGALVLMLGTSFLFISISLEHFSPLTVAHSRIVVAAIFTVCCVYALRLRIPFDLKSLSIFLILGCVGRAIPFSLISWGQQEVASGTTGLLMSVIPMITIVIAHFSIQGETMTKYKVIGVTTGFFGVALLLTPKFSLSDSLLYEAAILGAAICYALDLILTRRLSTFHPLVGSAGMLLAAWVLTVPFYYATQESYSDLITHSYSHYLLWLGIVPTGIATYLVFVLVNRAGPSFTSNMMFMIPVVAFFSGAIFLEEMVSTSSLIALLVILSGIFFTRLEKK